MGKSAGPSYRRALHNRDFRLLAGALTQSAMGGWAYNVALIVYVYDQTHSAAWVSAGTLCRMVPSFFASPYGGVIAERFERVHVMVSADLLRFWTMLGLTVIAATHSAAWLALVVAGLNAVIGTAYNPATVAMLPQLLGEDDLAAGNALIETINNVAIIAGPAVGAVVLALGSPAIVMGIDSVTFLISAALVWRIHARSETTDVSRDGGPFRQIAVGVRAIASSSTAVLLTSFTIVTTALYGVDTVLFLFLSKEKLGTGANYGYLLVALGVGGVIAALFVNRLAALPRLSLVLSAGMIAYAAPTALLVVVHSPTVAFVIQVVRGIATLIVDVLAMTALQRSLAPDMISRVFGVFWALVLGGLALGAFVTPFLLNGAGLDATILLTSLVVPACVVLVYPKLAALDRIAAVTAEDLAPRVRTFQRLDIFAAASQPVLERLAKSATELVLEPGTTVLRQGDDADALYVLTEGKVEVTGRRERGRKEHHIRYMSAPSYLGEIGLLQGIPRTATVTATEPCRLWRIDGDAFLEAVSQSTFSSAFVSGMSTRLRRTHHSQVVTLPGPREPEASEAAVEVPERVS
jgi:CRP-like cAMP-binding protein/predicted MFS family arabinose efflux permease